MVQPIIAKKYEVLAELGRGGMGVVYKVLHRGLNKVYALKILREQWVDDENLVARFQDEARIMASLHHPHIIQVFDIDRDGDQHYFVMEFIEGRTLSEILGKRTPLPLAEVIDIGRRVGQALDYAHRQRPPIIHRDIKPSNIMLETGTQRVVVTDFGIAKLLDVNRTPLTQSGSVIGTPLYAAPEQLRAVGDLDGRADVFPLGLVMYEMATARRLFDDMAPADVIGQKLFDPHELQPVFAPSVPVPFREIIRRSIAKDREHRYPSVAALLADLDRLDRRVLASPAKHPGRHYLPTILGASIVLLAGMIGFRSLFLHTESNSLPSPVPKPIDKPIGTEPTVNPTQSKGDSSSAPPVPKLEARPESPPTIILSEPRQRHVEMSEGDSQVFRVEAVASDKEPVEYRWFLDGQPTNDGPVWRYQPDFQASGTHEIRVDANGLAGRKAEEQWQVQVANTNRAPIIQNGAAIQRDLASDTGTAEFQVEVTDPDGDPLRFVWTLNGQTLPETGHRLDLKDLENGDYLINVTVSDTDSARAETHWQLKVRKPTRLPTLTISPQSPPVMTACSQQVFSVTNPAAFDTFQWSLNSEKQRESGPQFTLNPQAPGVFSLQLQASAGNETFSQLWQIEVLPAPVTNEDVNGWITRYQHALQVHDTDSLRHLGVALDGQQAVLQGRNNYEVILEPWNAIEQGGTVELTFNQIEHWYDPQMHSSVVEHSSQAFELKHNGCKDIVAVRK
ncbi:MAG: protein kinase [Gammaproteobacteria bacterium]|nr:protein kinase [Gammaproteobacteria bacterium]MCP5458111.1 protein kinase [Gammaproteobacteria bacterium]